ncbi:MAG: outer membrane beta-barrel protein [Paludibacteraceae bacterium]|nr:outer membrane beta-barrel protein [Paludibacteraceae bacterium]
MKKYIFLILFSLASTIAMPAESDGKKNRTAEIIANILANTGGGYSYDTDGYGKSQGFWVSTGYSFVLDDKLSVSPRLIYNWDNFSCDGGYTAEYKSLRIPVRVDYSLLNSSALNVGAYGGMDAERIFRVSGNTYDSDVRPMQCSVFAGAALRLGGRVSVNVGYRVGLLSFYKDGTGRNKGFEFSFNF